MPLRAAATERCSLLKTIKRLLPCSKKNTTPLVNQNDEANLAIVTDFVHQQLRMTNTPNPESFKVVFNPRYDAYSANDISHTIFVPRILKDVIEERNNKQKFATQAQFLEWYNDICEHRIDSFHLLYTYTQAGEKLSQVSDSLERMKLVFKQQDKLNYRSAQGFIDHEKTHILNRDVHKRIVLQSLTPEVAGIAFATGMQAGNELNLGELQSYLLSAGFVITSLPSYFLAYKALVRGQEWRADAGIRNDPKILEAVAEYFLYRAETTDPKDASVHVFWNQCSTHPLLKKRATELKRRAAQRHIKSYN